MVEFLALIWRHTDSRESQAAILCSRRLRDGSESWLHVLDAPGLSIYCSRPLPGRTGYLLLPGGRGVVFGRLFRSGRHGEEPSRVTELNCSETEYIVATGGRALTDRYWGRYVAFITDASTNTKSVLRDPTGGVECFHAEYQGVHLYFSSTVCPGGLPPIPHVIDWEYICSSVHLSIRDTRATGIRGMLRVMGGECITHREEALQRRWHWHPRKVIQDDVIEDPAVAAAELRRVVSYCVRCWAECYRGVLHMLSGGLDSSIVLGCMRGHQNVAVTCLNSYYTKAANSDERGFARMVATANGCGIVEQELNPRFSLAAMLGNRLLPSPTNYVMELGVRAAQLKEARRCGADAIFSGTGGDQLFCETGEEYICGDFIRLRGIRPRLFSSVMDAAYMHGVSVWSILAKAFRQASMQDPMNAITTEVRASGLAHREGAERARHTSIHHHPWWAEMTGVPVGKCWQVYLLSRSEPFHGPLAQAGDVEEVSPLLSQPVIETCLRIPSYIMMTGGRRRAIARRAFECEVPREILLRRVKAVVDEYAKTILVHNLDFVRELMLDGYLVKHRIVDRAKLETALSGRPTETVVYPLEVFSLISVEAWLVQWSSAQRRYASNEASAVS